MKRKHEIFVRWLEAQESPFKAIRKNRAQKNNVRDTDLNETEFKNILQCS